METGKLKFAILWVMLEEGERRGGREREKVGVKGSQR